MPSPELPGGFRFAGVASGIKPSGKPDISLIVTDRPAVAAAVYTQNQVVAAPVQLCRQRTPSESIRGVVTNSGNANACTGQRGLENAREMCRLLADKIDADPEQILVMSTGVIGKHLPMERVRSGVDVAFNKLGDSLDHFEAASDAILTTDKARKVEVASLQIAGRTVRLAAMAKGAGMIAPNMATMLGVILTDAVLTADQAQRLLAAVVATTFNCVSVDGHTSTNDTLLLLASGNSGAMIDPNHETAFAGHLEAACRSLARQLVADGEGATHVIEIQVAGAQTDDDAATIARAVGASPLVKTAITGGDPNWGRIVSAAGYAGPKIQPEKTSLSILDTVIYRDGAPAEFDEKTLSTAIQAAADVVLRLQVGDGDGKATHWASDLTVEYVRFNSEYTT
jgi:glutamate N-acetyltransferase/amino-acid N-acetyltransferase